MSRIVLSAGFASTGLGSAGFRSNPIGALLASGGITGVPGAPVACGARASTRAPIRAPPIVAPRPMIALSTNGRIIPRWTRNGAFFGGRAAARSCVAHFTQNMRVTGFGVPHFGQAMSPDGRGAGDGAGFGAADVAEVAAAAAAAGLAAAPAASPAATPAAGSPSGFRQLPQ